MKTKVSDIMEVSGVQFGTSGARGLVADMTDKVCYCYTLGFLKYLIQIGEFSTGGRVALAGDLRPSTPRILAACARAIVDCGGVPVYCGLVPTPALADWAFAEAIPSLMVTGSHIPDDRNGIKFYRPHGEVLKDDEAGMMGQDVAADDALFDASGALAVPFVLPEAVDVAGRYVARYRRFFRADALAGLKIGVYQHSAVGRDILLRIINELGGEGVALGRSERFIPVDTEAVREEDVALARAWARDLHLDAIVSTDGDSDRPLLADHTGTWLRGDVLGVLCARALGADAVVTPVSSNTVLEKCGAFTRTARTRIGSPYVIAEMQGLIAQQAQRVCGYEANGGFLLGCDIEVDGRALSALPTRDAVLPILAVLVAARPGTLADLVQALPPRVTYSERIKGLPTATSKAIIEWLLAGNDAARQQRIEACFGPIAGAALAEINTVDGLRMVFANADVIHLRPSGNAPELRCYTESGEAGRAKLLNDRALALVQDELQGKVAASLT